MEQEAARTVAESHKAGAKGALIALILRVEAHFAHMRSPLTVENCALCRTSMEGRAMLDRALAVASKHTVPQYPVRSPMQRATDQAPGSPSDSCLGNTAKVSLNLRESSWIRNVERMVSTPVHRVLPAGRHYAMQ